MPTLLIAHLDGDARIIWQSSYLSPYPADRIIGKRPWEFHDAENATLFRSALAAVMTEHQPAQVELRIAHIGRWNIRLFPCHQREVRIVCVCQQGPPELDRLSGRQLAVCHLLGEGFGTKEIAIKLGISRGTVDNIKSEISSRISLPSRSLPAWCGANAIWF